MHYIPKDLIQFGIKPSDDYSSRRLKKVLNISVIVAVISILIVVIVGTPMGLPLLWVLPFFLITTLFNLKNKSEIGMTMMLIFGNLLITFFSLMNGESNSIQMFFTVIIFGHTLLFVGKEMRWWYYFNLIVTVLCVLMVILSYKFSFFEGYSIKDQNLYNNEMLHFVLLIACTIVFSSVLARNFLKQYSILGNKIKEKDILLAEINHRVNNNLALIVGLMRLKKRTCTQDETKEVLNSMYNRVFTMASIQQKMYAIDGNSFIKISDFLNLLNSEDQNEYGRNTAFELNQNLTIESFPITQAIPLGMLLNELISNSEKYGFENALSPKIKIDFRSISKTQIGLNYNDNGVGLQKEELNNPEDLGLGLSLVCSLSEQLDGTYQFSNNNGFNFELKFNR